MREVLPARTVTLVLCRRDGSVLGSLPPFEVSLPWWQEVGPVVDGAREHLGVEVTILRLLAAEPNEQCAGGPVTYLAELDGGEIARCRPWPGVLDAEEPLRASWARPGGPAADVAWADAALAARGIVRAGPARQVRTWNLSSLWRLPLRDGAAWLKVVPPFFAHEGAVLACLDPAIVPEVVAADGPRVLLVEAPGEDQYEASGPGLLPMVGLLVGLQQQWVGREEELLDLGLADWRADALVGLCADLVARSAELLDREVLTHLDALVAGLPTRFERVDTCGLPDTLVHGDFHRGNLRASADRLVLLDWGDCGVGHPMLDQTAFLARLTDPDREAVRAEWARLWRQAVPGCDPDGAAALLEPVAALRHALIYRVFLDGIEPTERIYHAHDPGIWLERAAALAAA